MPTPQKDTTAPPTTDTHINRKVLDNPDELFDLVDRDDHVIGQVRRGDAHRNPALIHRSVQILLFTSDGRLLLQRRSATKDMFPGYFCASASGHVASGDDYVTTAHRELAEELGVAAPLTWIGKAIIESEPETEITALYVARSDGPFHFHPTETDGGALFTFAEALDGVTNASLPVTPSLRVAIEELARLAQGTPGGLFALLAQLG